MKKAMILGMIILASCQKYPELNKLDNDFFVQTGFDNSVDFKGKYISANTYYMPDTIRLLSDIGNDSIWCNNHSAEILKGIEAKLEINNFKRIVNTNERSTATIGIMVSHIRNPKNSTYQENAWWQKHSLYWNPEYWGWKTLYYTFNSQKNRTTDALLIEMIDIRDASKSDSTAVIWNMFAGGIKLDENKTTELGTTMNAIEQGFYQSPYLNLR